MSVLFSCPPLACESVRMSLNQPVMTTLSYQSAQILVSPMSSYQSLPLPTSPTSKPVSHAIVSVNQSVLI